MTTIQQVALWALIVGFIMTFVVITGFAYTTLLERKLLARFASAIRSKSCRIHSTSRPEGKQTT